MKEMRVVVAARKSVGSRRRIVLLRGTNVYFLALTFVLSRCAAGEAFEDFDEATIPFEEDYLKVHQWKPRGLQNNNLDENDQGGDDDSVLNATALNETLADDLLLNETMLSNETNGTSSISGELPELVTATSDFLLPDNTCSASGLGGGGCLPPLHVVPPIQKRLYTIGVLEFRGVGSALALHNITFGDYLTATAGQRFDPPLVFRMSEVNFQTMFDAAAEEQVDFVYVSPSPFACVEAEYGAQSLVSHISKRVIGGNTYELSKFGGVILARADNDEINGIVDLKDKVVASAAISSFGGGQMQFREVENVGLSYINDPKQLVFTGDQAAIVQGVLSGKFDAGFVRTDQTERTTDAETGEPIDKTLLKVLDPKENYLNGEPFPFTASTQLYPEWNLAALTHVPAAVAREVQAAMLALAEHAELGAIIDECLGNYTLITQDLIDMCADFDRLVPHHRCDSTHEIARIAQAAMIRGQYAGFRSTRSYFEIHAMLQDTRFAQKDGATWRCARPAELYDAIICPSGHFKKNKDQVERGCETAGLPCDEEHQCVCNPCVKAFDVDVSPVMLVEDRDTTIQGAGCAKMSLCGITEQTKPLQFRAVDNKLRQLSTMNVTILQASQEIPVPVEQFPHSNIYEFQVVANEIGVLIVEVFMDGEQIPESPVRVQIVARNCETDYPNQHREPDAEGTCICQGNTIEIGNTCVSYAILIPSIVVPCLLIVAVLLYCYVEKKKREADAVWSVDPEDLIFPTPLQIIGQGTFGMVLLAEFRGTLVAVKRVMPPMQEDNVDSGSMRGGGLGTMLRRKASDSMLMSSVSAAFSMKKQPEQYPMVDDDIEEGSFSGKSSGMHSTLDASSRGMATAGGMATTAGGNGSMQNSARRRKRQYQRAKQEFMSEMRLLSKLRHPCITTVMGAVIQANQDPMLIMEYMNHGSLYDLLHNETMVIEGEFLLHMLRDIASGVRFLHAAKPHAVIHGDLKSANVLVDDKFRAKVADFGLTQKKQVAGAGITGTPFFMAPELLRGQTSHTAASDMYAIGIIFFELYSRKEPYEGENPEEVLQLVCDPQINKRPPVPKSCPPAFAKLMKLLLSADPGQRPTASELDNRLKDATVASVEPGQMTLNHRGPQAQQQSQGSNQNRDFLYQIFPTHIADVLVSGGKVEPESHEIVTIFFSDIVGFTTIASTIEPIKISNLLDRLYLAFDGLARKYDVFKIETIGDAYMCSSNLAKDQSEDHVKRIAEFAMEAVEAASKVLIDEEDPDKGYVQIRAGFHSGPVVSNVVGSLNPRYGVFGDTVNVSSRMESTSEKGRIQCSERSAHLLPVQAPGIPLRLRGETKVKGKGSMTTYWVGESDPELYDLVTVFAGRLVLQGTDTANAQEAPPGTSSSSLIAGDTPHHNPKDPVYKALQDALYLELDGLALKHEVFRIEASSDAYMCASNIAKDQSYDHVKKIAEFAIEAIQVAKRVTAAQPADAAQQFELSCGFHSGSATASVMGGIFNPKYEVSGDACKMARRLSHNSHGSRILCSDTSAGLLAAQAPAIQLKMGKELSLTSSKSRRNTAGNTTTTTSNTTTYWVNEVTR